MHTAAVRFAILQTRDSEAVAHAASSLLAAWRKNGQVLGKVWALVASGNSIAAYVSLPETSSLNESFANPYVRDATSALLDAGLATYCYRPGPRSRIGSTLLLRRSILFHLVH